MSQANTTQQELFSASNIAMPETTPANEQDKIDAARYRWLASRINNDSLAVYQVITGQVQPLPNSELEKIIDEGILVEQSLKKWLTRNDDAK